MPSDSSLVLGKRAKHEKENVRYNSLDLSAVMSLVEVPRAPAGEEPADITGFPPLPIEDYCNAQAAIPLKQQTNHCPPKPLWDTCSSQIST